jgi:hypothetical protein
MEKPRKRLLGPAAISILAAASVVGVQPAVADDVCLLDCVVEPPSYNAPGLDTAFFKLAEKQFPGATAGAFLQKVDTQNAFVKLAQKGFPGNTAAVFLKQR